MKDEKRSVLRDAWRLAWPYWSSSEERWRARGLLAAVIMLNLGLVYIDVRINQWNRAFYDALQQLDAQEFFRQIGIFSMLAGAYILIAVYSLYLNQMLQIRWRRWLTRRYLDAWLADRNYFRLQLTKATTDNPDQRISEDLNLFTTYTMTLTLGLLSAVVSLASFMVILWGLSGPAAIPLGSWGTIHIPAYLVWAALLYAGVGTWITVKIGRPLVRLNFDQQRYEADFRFSMVRLRENAESVAFYRGEPRELDTFHDRFRMVFDNFWRIMLRRKQLRWFTSGYDQLAAIFPIVVAAPRYFAKEIQLGALMQVVDAFASVQSSLSFIISSYTEIASWQAVVQRLATFDDKMRETAARAEAPQTIEIERQGGGLGIAGLDLDLPDGTPLLRGLDLAVAPAESVLVSGPTGAGKSTLLRAVAGLWPFGRGRIRLGEGSTLFLPQRPYLPLGTLRDALLYPRQGQEVGTERLAGVLEEVGLGGLAPELDTADDWSHRLSLGEQQRLAFARILLTEPAIVFLDEATSALDEPGEAKLYGLLQGAAWRPTVVSVGHRGTLRAMHQRVLDLGTLQPPRGALSPAAG